MNKSLLLQLIFVFLIIACKKKEETPIIVTPTSVVNSIAPIGEYREGGIIFWIDSLEEHGLVVALNDVSIDALWGCSGIELGASDTALGTGENNTLDILAGCSDTTIAAYQCANYSYEEYNDWFSPSKDELSEIYPNIDSINKSITSMSGTPIGIELTWYMSSSEVGKTNYWSFTYYQGGIGIGHKFRLEDEKIRARAIRKF